MTVQILAAASHIFGYNYNCKLWAVFYVHNSVTDLCPCGETQTMSHIVESCPLTKLNGGLSRLHSADEDAVSWLTNYSPWHAYQKEKKERIHSLTISYQARHKHKTAGAEHSRSRPVPHCRVLPPDEFDSITSDLSPGCTESYVMTAETIFTQVIRNKETKVRNIVITLI